MNQIPTKSERPGGTNSEALLTQNTTGYRDASHGEITSERPALQNNPQKLQRPAAPLPRYLVTLDAKAAENLATFQKMYPEVQPSVVFGVMVGDCLESARGDDIYGDAVVAHALHVQEKTPPVQALPPEESACSYFGVRLDPEAEQQLKALCQEFGLAPASVIAAYAGLKLQSMKGEYGMGFRGERPPEVLRQEDREQWAQYVRDWEQRYAHDLSPAEGISKDSWELVMALDLLKHLSNVGGRTPLETRQRKAACATLAERLVTPTPRELTSKASSPEVAILERLLDCLGTPVSPEVGQRLRDLNGKLGAARPGELKAFRGNMQMLVGLALAYVSWNDAEHREELDAIRDVLGLGKKAAVKIPAGPAERKRIARLAKQHGVTPRQSLESQGQAKPSEADAFSLSAAKPAAAKVKKGGAK